MTKATKANRPNRSCLKRQYRKKFDNFGQVWRIFLELSLTSIATWQLCYAPFNVLAHTLLHSLFCYSHCIRLTCSLQLLSIPEAEEYHEKTAFCVDKITELLNAIPKSERKYFQDSYAHNSRFSQFLNCGGKQLCCILEINWNLTLIRSVYAVGRKSCFYRVYTRNTGGWI